MNELKRTKDEFGKMGRGRLLPVVASIGQASGVTGAPEALIKSAKRDGCKAFLSNNRVDLEILIPFLFAMLKTATDIPEGFCSWADFWKSRQAMREDVKLQKDKGELMPVSDAMRQAAEAAAFYWNQLDRMERELPTALAGLSALQASEVLNRAVEDLRNRAEEKFKVTVEK